ncbi:putative C-type lectin domain family 20 member A [Hemibagrus wyckioides]|nr:putative C-type lectin domain family 20 member A [Hemibagrus wyckioides]
MDQCLFMFLYFTGVFPLVLSFTRYYLIQQGKTWTDAQAYCRDKHTDLVMIQTSDVMVQIQNEAQRQQFSSSAWIGLYDDVNSWRWSMGNEPLGTMKAWNAGQPDNWMGNEACGAISGSRWADIPCTSTCPFMCFDDTKTGNERYIYISDSMTWSAAQAYCRTNHTDLVSARDETENSVIAGMIPGLTWIGLFRDKWKWIDKNNFSSTSWLSANINNAMGNEDCGYLNNGRAADAQCSDIMPFFCYSEITGKLQIIRVKVRSSQDVKDPAVKEAILEQIKKKLKDHGMAKNITVKWREQPDGNVFHKEKENNSTG